MTTAAHALATPRLRLRPATPDDLGFLLALRDPPAPPDAPRDARVRALVERNAETFEAFGFGLWLLHDGDRDAGFVGLRPRERASEPELYYGLAPAARGRGLATEAARAVIARLFATPGAIGVWAVTDPENLASARVLEQLGMRLEHEGEFDGKPSRVYRLRRAGGAMGAS